jgi:multidrug efflux pump subunit AcrB
MQMMEKWLQRKLGARIVMGVLLALGVLSYFTLSFDLNPDIEFPRLTIATFYPNSSPETVEMLVTSPIESRVQRLAHLRKISSTSWSDRSFITLEFDRKSDMPHNCFLLAGILDDYEEWLPAGVRKPDIRKYIPEQFKKQLFLSFSLLSDLPRSELYETIEKQIKPNLQSIPGVANVSVYGLRAPVLNFYLDKNKMENFGLRLAQVRQKLQGKLYAGGSLWFSDHRIAIKIDDSFHSIKEIQNIPFPLKGNITVHLKDFCRVSRGYADPINKKRLDGKNTVLLYITRSSSANTLKTADRVFKAIGKLEQRLKNKGVSFIVEQDTSRDIRKQLLNIYKSLMIAITSLFLLMYLIFRNVYVPLIVFFNMLLTFCTVFFFLKLYNYSLNILVLSALAMGFGFMIDNAILFFDSIDQQKPSQSILIRIQSGLSQITRPVWASTITTCTALLPFMFTKEKIAMYYIPFAVVVIITLGLSVIVAYLFMPHLFVLYTKHDLSKRFFIISDFYAKGLKILLRKHLLVTWLFIWAIGIPVWLLPVRISALKLDSFWSKPGNVGIQLYNQTMGSEICTKLRKYVDPVLGGSTYYFFKHVQKGFLRPDGRQTMLMVLLKLPRGSDFVLMENTIMIFEEIALMQDGLKRIETSVLKNQAIMMVAFTDQAIRQGVHHYLERVLINRAVMITGMDVSVSGSGKGYSKTSDYDRPNLRLVLSGYNYSLLKKLARKIESKLSRHPRVRNVDINAYRLKNQGHTETPMLKLELNRSALAGLALYGNEVLSAIQLYMHESIPENRLLVSGQEIIFQIKTLKPNDIELSDLHQTIFSTFDGRYFRMSDFSTSKNEPQKAFITKENQQYEKVIAFDFIGTYAMAQKYLKQAVLNTYLPPGYKLDTDDVAVSRSSDKRNLFICIILGLLLIYMVTSSLYESFRNPFLIYLSIPAGFIGIFLLYSIFELTFTRNALIGVLFVSGIVVNNAIILISRYQRMQKYYSDLSDIIVSGSCLHIRPVFLTTMTTLIGFGAMLLFNNQENFWRSIALTGIGGMTTSLLYILFVLPALYFQLEKKRNCFAGR